VFGSISPFTGLRKLLTEQKQSHTDAMFTNAIGSIVRGPAHDPFRRRTRLLFTRVSTRSYSTVCGWKKRRSTRRIVRHDVNGDWMWAQQNNSDLHVRAAAVLPKTFTRQTKCTHACAQTHARMHPNMRSYF